MKIKPFVFFIIILMVTSCGFSPIYDSQNKINYKIVVIEIKGDRYLNNIINNEIKSISNSNSEKVIKLKLNTIYEKTIISKDSKGTASEYEIKVKSMFAIENFNNKILVFDESQILKNTSNIFQQKNYENTIKANFASSIVRKLKLSLVNIR